MRLNIIVFVAENRSVLVLKYSHDMELKPFWVVGLGDGAGQLPVPGRPTTLAYGRARAC